jgi:heat shock protein HslJ
MDTAAIMRPHRTFATLALLVSMLASPVPALAQAETPADLDQPAALAPDGTLPLEGTPWRLAEYRWKGSSRTPGPEVAAAMTLTAGRLEATGGCTAFKGTYGTMGSAIAFDLGKLKQNECAEQTTIVQRGLLDGLRKARAYRLEAGATGDQLVLTNAGGVDVLRFGLDDIGRLSPATWRLEAFVVEGQRQEVDPVAGPDLVFRSERRVNEARRRWRGDVLSSTGCNGIRAEFFAQGNVISFAELQTTDAPCPDSLLAQQDVVLSVLGATTLDVSLPADRLVLTSRDSGDALEYRALAALEGTTWLLAPGRDEIVTIRLEDGVASGYGPCGPYSAAYATDGLFITFSRVADAGDGSCASSAEERRLLGALREAAIVDRHAVANAARSRLVLRDARGQRVATVVSGSQAAP